MTRLKSARFSLPVGSRDTPRTFRAKMTRVNERLTKQSLTNPAVANALIYMGVEMRFHSFDTQGHNETQHYHFGNDCSFPIGYYFIWLGLAAFSLYVVKVVSRHLLRYILISGIHSNDFGLLYAIEIISYTLVLCEILCVISMTVLLFPMLPRVQIEDESQPEYCTRKAINYSTVFFVVLWTLLLIGLVGFVYLEWNRYRFEKIDSDSEEYENDLLINDSEWYD